MTLQHTPSRAFSDDEPMPPRRSQRPSSLPRKERVLVAQKRREVMERESRRAVLDFFNDYDEPQPPVPHGRDAPRGGGPMHAF